MSVSPKSTCFFIPSGLSKFKHDLFERIAANIQKAGGSVVRHRHEEFRSFIEKMPDTVPIVGCTPELRPLIDSWKSRGRAWIYWDRGYARRVFATWLPRGDQGGYYRWTLNGYQLRTIRDLPSDRWDALKTEVRPWSRDGRHIVVAHPTPTYSRFHGLDNWTGKTVEALSKVTDRQIVVRDKESRRPLQSDLDGAHCLVAHGSNAAVEAVIMGCPVVVHPDSAAALVGLTDLARIDAPVYPDREPWLRALAYSQFDETELVDGTLWRHLG